METATLLIIVSESKDIVLGAVGGTVAYLFEYIKAKKSDDKFDFVASSMFVHMALGAFVGYSVGTFLTSDVVGRNAIVSFSGVTSYSILLLADNRFATWLVDKIGMKIEGDKDAKK